MGDARHWSEEGVAWIAILGAWFWSWKSASPMLRGELAKHERRGQLTENVKSMSMQAEGGSPKTGGCSFACKSTCCIDFKGTMHLPSPRLAKTEQTTSRRASVHPQHSCDAACHYFQDRYVSALESQDGALRPGFAGLQGLVAR